MANYNGRIPVVIEIPARTVPHMIVQCAACGKQDVEPYHQHDFWQMIPPIGGWTAAEENFACLDCVNKINEMFGVAAQKFEHHPPTP